MDGNIIGCHGNIIIYCYYCFSDEYIITTGQWLFMQVGERNEGIPKTNYITMGVELGECHSMQKMDSTIAKPE